MSRQIFSIETQIKAKAYSLGFSLAGVTDSNPLEHYSLYCEWLDKGRHAEMAYLSTPRHIEARKDPHLVWPEVKSILVLGLEYPLHEVRIIKEMNHGLISGYAYGEDYHSLVPRMLEPLLSWLKSFNGNTVKAMIYTDSAPILERELAARAGLGWIGKNSCLISPTIGSNLLLSEVFLNIHLSPDQPFTADRCGSCNLCVEACPTKAIQTDRTINSNLCISYHTIENRGDIPYSISKDMGNWIFGCDICQMVCPWNNRPNSRKLTNSEGTHNRYELEDLMQIDEKDFRLRYGNSSIKRAKREGFIRNIGIALHNLEKMKND